MAAEVTRFAQILQEDWSRGSQHEPRMVPDNLSGRSGKRDGGFAFADKRVRRADKTPAGGFHIVTADTTRQELPGRDRERCGRSQHDFITKEGSHGTRG